MIILLFFYIQQNQKEQKSHFKLEGIEGFLAQGVKSEPLLLKARQNAMYCTVFSNNQKIQSFEDLLCILCPCLTSVD